MPHDAFPDDDQGRRGADNQAGNTTDGGAAGQRAAATANRATAAGLEQQAKGQDAICAS